MDENGFSELRYAILDRAINDWKLLCRGKKIGTESVEASFKLLQKFFHRDIYNLLPDDNESIAAKALDYIYSIKGAPERPKEDYWK